MKVYVTRPIPETGIKMMTAAGYEVTVSTKNGVLTRKELLTALREHNPDAVLCLLTDKIDEEVFDAAPNAQIFANYAVGFDNVDLAAAKKHGVTITNTPDVLTDTVAEHTIALMLSLTSRITEADRFTRAGRYDSWAPMMFLGTDLRGKTLGILGSGRIGSRVAEIARNGLGMNILYYDLKENTYLSQTLQARYYSALEEILKDADVVSVHLPLIDSTRHLINRERLAQMNPSSYLINTSRGPIIDEAALVEALEREMIKGAALDVYENEPVLAPGLTKLENVVITPHIASASEETRSKMSEIAATNINMFLKGEVPPNRVVL